MPELPEVESARSVIERAGLDRVVADVDDTDSYVCRPHSPGQIRAALLGRSLTVAHRRGKSMWIETSSDGPALGIHLGMSGKIVIWDGVNPEIDGGDYWNRGRAIGDHRFTRFSLTFEDGGYLLLVDPRRLGRVRLDPPVGKLGPDALTVKPAEFRHLLERSSMPLKSRLMDQDALAGIGNLLADQILWTAKLSPVVPARDLTRVEADRLHRAVRRAVDQAIEGGGVHTLSIIPFRTAGAECPRDHAEMAKTTVGGRTTWYCPQEQAS